jgi:NADH-quinone oxidoreductase subunit N
MWVPDIYEGAPTSVTLFIGTLPKLAAFGMAIRLLMDSLPALSPHWQPLLVVMSILSMAVGNIVAIAQTNIKRMLAYSTIGHVGFLLLGLLAGPESGYSAAFTYVIIYSLTTLGAFGIILSLSKKGFEADKLSDYQGLGITHPWIAFLMLLILFSLAGVPPLVGFYAKFLVLQAVINAGFVWLAALAVLFSVVGTFFYLRVIRIMFF